MARPAIATSLPAHGRHGAILITLVGMLMATPTLPMPAASGASSGVPAPTSGVYLGSWVKPLKGESKQQALVAREQQIGRRYAIDHQYYSWNASIPTSHERWTAEQGRIPFVTWNARRSDGTVASWGRIASGAEDAWIAARADAFKSFGIPVYLSFHHEPENDVPAVGQPSEFAAAFRRIVEVFRGRGATNVTFVWTMMAWSFEKQGAEASRFYPGDAYVDVVAADGYNWYPGRAGAKWRSFEEIMANTRAFAVAHGKVFMAAEYGVQEDPASPGRKGDWYRDIVSVAMRWPELIALVYFDSDKIYRWMPDTSSTALAGYRALALDEFMSPMVGPVVSGPTPTPTPTESPTPTPTESPTPTPTESPTSTPWVDLSNSFEGGREGTDLSTSGSGGASGDPLDEVRVTNGSAMEYDDTHAIGALAVRHRVAADGDANYAWLASVPAGGVWHGRVYVWFDGYPTGITRIVRGQEGKDLRFAIDLLSTGRLRVVDSRNVQILATSVALARSTWVRIEWAVDHGAGVVELRLFNDGSSLAPSAVVSSATGRSIGDLVTRVQFGRSGHQDYATTFWTDQPALSGASVGPVG